MNLLHTISSIIITLISIIILPNSNNEEINGISNIAILIILIQTTTLHAQSSHENNEILLLLTNNSTINNLTFNISGFSIDNISTSLLLLTSLLIITCILISENTIYHTQNSLLICLYSTTLILYLTFTTSNLLLFYIYFESSIIPLFLIIGIWGSRNENVRAGYYFLIYTIAGSLPLFLTILNIHNNTGTFNNTALQQNNTQDNIQIQLFLGLFLAFAINTPLIPWHSWLPLAHVEAPGIGSILLAGILLKLGTYGFIRFTIPILPQISNFLSPLIITVSIISMWLASINSLRQNDINRIIAYSSIAHMGIITAACFSTNSISTKGAIILMISHGLTSSTLFALTSFLYERHNSRLINNFQGSSYTTPILSTLMFITALAHMSTPGSINFIGEYLCLLGLWELHPSITILSTIGIFITTTYLLLLYIQISSSNPCTYNNYNITDLQSNEINSILTLTIPNILIGLFPFPILNDHH